MGEYKAYRHRVQRARDYTEVTARHGLTDDRKRDLREMMAEAVRNTAALPVPDETEAERG